MSLLGAEGSALQIFPIKTKCWGDLSFANHQAACLKAQAELLKEGRGGWNWPLGPLLPLLNPPLPWEVGSQ